MTAKERNLRWRDWAQTPARLETSVFIWSAYKYYLRQRPDSYIVF